MLGPDAMRGELAKIKAQTGRPFNVNFFCHTPPTPDAKREAAWRAALSPFYKKYGIDPENIPAGPGRTPFSAEAADVLSEFKPAVVSFHFGLPPAQLLARARACGSKVLSSATTVEEALWLEAHGVDAVIAQGLEAGGHRGMFLSDDLSTQLGTFALLPQVVRAVKLPVIAAGGIADAQGVAAAMALGAAGVQIGTAYLLCPEATTSAVHRAALKSEAARHTALTNLFESARPDQRRRAGVSPGHRRHRPLARQGRKRRRRRFLSALVRPERRRLQGNTCRPAHAGIGRRSLVLGRRTRWWAETRCRFTSEARHHQTRPC